MEVINAVVPGLEVAIDLSLFRQDETTQCDWPDNHSPVEDCPTELIPRCVKKKVGCMLSCGRWLCD